MTSPLCRCGCGQPVERRSYETDGQWRRRSALGIFRDKCRRNHPAKVDRPKPDLPLSLVSCNLERPEIRIVERKKPVRDQARLAFARSMPCCICGAVEGVHAHHVLTNGLGTKCGDQFTAPLCYICHGEVHQVGRASFEKKYKLDLLVVALSVNNAYNALTVTPTR